MKFFQQFLCFLKYIIGKHDYDQSDYSTYCELIKTHEAILGKIVFKETYIEPIVFPPMHTHRYTFKPEINVIVVYSVLNLFETAFN